MPQGERRLQTMVGFAWELVQAGRPNGWRYRPGEKTTSLRGVEELPLIAECSEPDEWADVVAYLPL